MQTIKMWYHFLQFYIGISVCFAVCPNGWTRFMDSCYFFGHQDETFKDAERSCTHLGSHLVAIETAAESAFIRSVLTQLNSNRHWIGLTDEVIEGVWTWYHNDQTATYTNWYPDQPNGGASDNCADIYSAAPYSYQWVDSGCNDKYRAICEKDIQTEVIGK